MIKKREREMIIAVTTSQATEKSKIVAIVMLKIVELLVPLRRTRNYNIFLSFFLKKKLKLEIIFMKWVE